MLAQPAILENLLGLAGLDAGLARRVAFTGTDPVLPSSFRLAAAAQACIAASAVAAVALGEGRGLPGQHIGVDARHAMAEFRSDRYFSVDGQPPGDVWDAIAGLYQCGDGRYVRLHTNFPHHRDGILNLLGCANDRQAVAAALKGWMAEAFETAATEAQMVVAMARSFAEWDAHPQGQAVAALPPFTIERIGEAAPRPLSHAARPLAGLRVLDLTRIIAGPVAGRTLAAHGADVLLVTSPYLPSVPALVIDTGRGKRAAHLDLRAEADREQLAGLVSEADIFLQGYRPGGLAMQGFAPHEVAALRPGSVYLSLSAYGHAGPWAMKRGFDSLVQTASGFNLAEAEAAGDATPRALPCQALDYAAGYLLAFAGMAARLRQARDGGSWLVRDTLAPTAHWLRGLGRVADGFSVPDMAPESVADLTGTHPSGFGALRAIRHPAQLSVTPARFERPSVPLGTDAPVWLPLEN
jgi:crotonobetainyl-CoA:carnitine CoA-transferase CaiB-like acyl-CoA transferase